MSYPRAELTWPKRGAYPVNSDIWSVVATVSVPLTTGRKSVVTRIDLATEIENFIKTAPNNAYLEGRLKTLADPDRLLLFLHRFLVFNDALAARVPFLAGLIHLTPGLFVDPDAPNGFLGQVNARIAAHVAEAANDEYRMAPGRSMVHQHLSQVFFRGALSCLRPEYLRDFESRWPLPAALETLLSEARTKFLAERTPHGLFAALGFHVGLEFFANEEFNLVDRHLCEVHPRLVEALKREGEGPNDYTWLALHTVVEIGHYRAGLEAVTDALAYYRDPAATPEMARAIMDGLEAFADLQRRYYQAVFAELP